MMREALERAFPERVGADLAGPIGTQHSDRLEVEQRGENPGARLGGDTARGAPGGARVPVERDLARVVDRVAVDPVAGARQHRTQQRAKGAELARELALELGAHVAGVGRPTPGGPAAPRREVEVEGLSEAVKGGDQADDGGRLGIAGGSAAG